MCIHNLTAGPSVSQLPNSSCSHRLYSDKLHCEIAWLQLQKKNAVVLINPWMQSIYIAKLFVYIWTMTLTEAFDGISITINTRRRWYGTFTPHFFQKLFTTFKFHIALWCRGLAKSSINEHRSHCTGMSFPSQPCLFANAEQWCHSLCSLPGYSVCPSCLHITEASSSSIPHTEYQPPW